MDLVRASRLRHRQPRLNRRLSHLLSKMTYLFPAVPQRTEVLVCRFRQNARRSSSVRPRSASTWMDSILITSMACGIVRTAVVPITLLLGVEKARLVISRNVALVVCVFEIRSLFSSLIPVFLHRQVLAQTSQAASGGVQLDGRVPPGS